MLNWSVLFQAVVPLREPVNRYQKRLWVKVNGHELRLHVIWALAHIGGENVKETLQALLEKAHDNEEADVIERALDLLEFSEELPDLDL